MASWFSESNLTAPPAMILPVAVPSRNIVTNAANQLTTITATGAPADLMPLQQHHRQPAFGQFQRGVDAGKATANDADVGLLLPLQDRQPELLVGGRGVIRRSVLVGMG